MKRLFPFLLCFLLSLSILNFVCAGAVDEDSNLESISDLPEERVEEPPPLESDPDPDPEYILSDGVLSTTDPDLELTEVRLMSVAPVEPENDGSLKSVLLSLIGAYDPVVLEYQYSNGNGYTSFLREVQLDYPWLAAALLFMLVLYCVFKIGGRILWNK